MAEEKNLLRLGGLGGLLAGALSIVAIVVLVAFLLPLPETSEELIRSFPGKRAAFIAANSLFLATVILGVTLFLALYRALRGRSLASALVGAVLGILGLVVLAIAALPASTTVPLSDIYHASGATAEEQATVVLLHQAIQGVFTMLNIVGWVLVSLGLVALGVAMLGTPGFGRGFGGVSVVLGLVGLGGVVWGVVGLAVPALSLGDPGTLAVVVPPIVDLVFLFLLGGKVYSLSRTA